MKTKTKTAPASITVCACAMVFENDSNLVTALAIAGTAALAKSANAEKMQPSWRLISCVETSLQFPFAACAEQSQ